MADADEDHLPSVARLSNPTNSKDADSDSGSDADSDTAPDYRFLPNASTTGKKHALPPRGEKDFEPNATIRQSNTLEKSRNAMADALGVLRVHSIKKGEMIGVYFPNEEDWDGMRYDKSPEDNDVDSEFPKLKRPTPLTIGEGRCVVVERFTNTYVRTMGKSDRRNWVWLLPEEALYLLERGTLDIRYDMQEESDEDEDSDSDSSASSSSEESQSDAPSAELKSTPNESAGASDETSLPASTSVEATLTKTPTNDPQQPSEDNQPRLQISDIPMSLQGAYAAFIGKGDLTLERYTVYANLKRAGYIVQRAPTWYGPDSPTTLSPSPEVSAQTTSSNTDSRALTTQPISLISRLLSYIFKSQPRPNSIPCHNSISGPLISPGLFRNYYDLYRQLHLIPQYTHTETSSSLPSDEPEPAPQPGKPTTTSTPNDTSLYPTYTLHKPSALQGYKKSAPPPPHYRVVVLPARQTLIPTSTQIGDLLAGMPEDSLPNADRKKLETRIKHGKRNVLLAIVDSGLVSYVRFSSGGFEESLWNDNERRGVATGRGGKYGRGGGGRGSRGGGRGRGRGRGSGSGNRGG